MRWADVMLQKVAAVVQDLQDEKEGRRLSEQILPQAEGFQVAPAMRGQVAARSAPATMFSEGDIGVLPPLGVWDPLGYIDSRDMRRYEEMEIKHGRAAMLGFTHVILTEAGLRFPGYLSDGTFGGAPIKFADVPAGAINTVLAIPGSSWAQIICLCGVLESGVFTQDPDREAGDIAPEWGPWVRYDDPEARTFKLNVERQNGRAAMLGRAAACSKSDSSGLSNCVGPMDGVLRVSSRSYDISAAGTRAPAVSFHGFGQDILASSEHLRLEARQASRASSCTSSWAWMGSTRRVASRPGPLRRPSSKHEARAARPDHFGKVHSQELLG